jgi:hypothetical protein
VVAVAKSHSKLYDEGIQSFVILVFFNKHVKVKVISALILYKFILIL